MRSWKYVSLERIAHAEYGKRQDTQCSCSELARHCVKFLILDAAGECIVDPVMLFYQQDIDHAVCLRKHGDGKRDDIFGEN
jgi:hypothetical protein